MWKKLYRTIDRGIDRLVLSGAYLSGALLLILGLIIFVEVVLRYFFNAPTAWVFEYSIYLVMGATFLILANTIRSDNLIRVELLLRFYPPRMLRALEIFVSVIGIIFSGVLLWKGLEMAIHSYTLERVSTTIMRTPLYIPQSLIPLGGLLLTLQFLRRLAHQILGQVQSEQGGLPE